MLIGNYKEFSSSGDKSLFDDFEKVPYKYQDDIYEYLNTCSVALASPGIVFDVVKNKNTNMAIAIRTDGLYSWRSDLAYYVKEYNLRLPEFFENYILDKIGKKKITGV